MAPAKKDLSNVPGRQPNLFSFFQKKPGAASSTPAQSPSSLTPSAAQADNSIAGDATSFSPQSTPSPSTSMAGPAFSSAVADKVAKYGPEVVGWRMEVWWPDDKDFYAARIESYNAGNGKHAVRYDDGDREELDLAREVIRWEEKQGLVTPMGGEAGPEVKRRRLLRQDDSESEEEFLLATKTMAKAGASGRLMMSSEKGQIGGKRKAGLRTPGGAFAQAGVAEEEDEEEQERGGEEEDETPGSKRSKHNSGTSKGSTSIDPTPPRISKSSARPSSSSPFTTPPPAGTMSGIKRSSSASSSNPSNEEGEVKERADGVFEAGEHIHNQLSWLKQGSLRDRHGRKPEHPDYDHRTLWIPMEFLKKETPAMKQWWDFKRDNFDTVLFFKVGKFYELFHMDADVGVEEAGLIYMKGDKAHSGFPEAAFGNYSNMLVNRGYRIARVEQTETPEDMKASNTSAAKGYKRQVVSRELCSVLSKGTRTFCYLDEADTEDDVGSSGPLLMAIKETIQDDAATEAQEPRITYGICMVDPTTGKFQLGQFEDSAQRWRLSTLLSQFKAAEVLLERSVASQRLQELVRYHASSALIEYLRPQAEFWDARRTVSELKAGKFFPRASKKEIDYDAIGDDGVPLGISRWPSVLQLLIAGGQHAELALSGLGAVVWQLHRSLIDQDLLTMQNFYGYAPPDLPPRVILQDKLQPPADAAGFPCDLAALGRSDIDDPLFGTNTLTSSGSAEERPSSDKKIPGERLPPLVLDGTTLANLEIFRNSYDKTSKGSLWEYMNKTRSAFGARLFKEWMCRPLQMPQVINGRLDATEELMGDLSPEADGIRAMLKKMPDLERQLARHHSLGAVHRSEDHPESRAVYYETQTYNRRQITDLCSALDGLNLTMRIKNMLLQASAPPQSRLLQRILQTFPDLSEPLQFFAVAFDAQQAKREGIIIPRPGVSEVYDQAKQSVDSAMADLHAYLAEQRRSLGSNEINYWGNGKDRFQLEVPEAVLRRHTPAEYISKSNKKGWRRFHTPEIIRMVEELVEAETAVEDALRAEMVDLFAKFDEYRCQWACAVQNTALLDCLLSLAEVSSHANFCRPIISTAAKPFVSIRGGRHPCLEARTDNFIPNDLDLGSPHRPERLMLLSGPNMGGKSTLLRQTCVIAIMAQMGCYVPADSYEATPIDRIFTRVGATDRILHGQSTFFVELSETANILHNATASSLVILDELGRGTSTFDGTAIAHAVISFLVRRVQCLSLFATHYHSLVEDWRGNDQVCFGHMACHVEAERSEQRIIFMYRLAEGPSPKSYGLNVARLAHLPPEVIQVAKEKSEIFEAFMEQGNTGRPAIDQEVALGAEIYVLVSLEGKAIVPQARRLWGEVNQ